MSKSKAKVKMLKISIIGDSKTGKTSIINCFSGHEFNINTLTSIGIDKQEVSMTMKDGKEIKLIIWDTAGQERYYSISSGTIKNSHGIIVCFALNDKESFTNVVTWLEDVREISTNIPIVLFGNKCDLTNERKVTYEEAEDFAKNNEMVYFETSAKDNINIKEGFEKIAEDAYEKDISNRTEKIKISKQNNKNKKKKCCSEK